MVLFFETCAVLKRYLTEPGSTTIEELVGLPAFKGGRFISTGVLLETHHMLGHKYRIGNLTETEYRDRISRLTDDRLIIWTVLPTLSDTVAEAARKARLDYTRGIDAFDHLHVAAALHASIAVLPEEDWVFVSSDERLVAYAKDQGLKCFDPIKGAVADLLARRFA